MNFAAPTHCPVYFPSENYRKQWGFKRVSLFNLPPGSVRADDEVDVDGTVEADLGKSREGSRTDDEVVQRFVFIKTILISPLNTGYFICSSKSPGEVNLNR